MYYSTNIIITIKSRRMRWAGHETRMGESIKTLKVLVGKPEREIPPGRPEHGSENNIELDMKKECRKF
jgi:hypothetical protein